MTDPFAGVASPVMQPQNADPFAGLASPVIAGEDSGQSFIQQAMQPLKNIPNEMNKAASDALTNFKSLPVPSDSFIQRGLDLSGNALNNAAATMEYLASPLTGVTRALASNPAKNIAIGAGLSPESAETYVAKPIDFASSLLLPSKLAEMAPSALDAVKNSALLRDTSSGAIPIPFTKTGPNIKAGFNASDVEELDAAKERGHATVSTAYQAPSLQNTTLTPTSENQLINEILDGIGKIGPQGTVIGSTINPSSSPKTIGAVSQIYNRIVNGYTHPITGVTTPNVPLSVSEIDGFRKLLSNTSGEDSAAANGVRETIDNFLNNVGPSHLANGTPQAIQDLNNARATAAQNFKYQDVADILIKSNGDPNKIQNGLIKWLSDPDNTSGLSADTISGFKDAANGTGGQNFMKLLGKLGFGTSNALGSVGVTALTVPLLGPIGAPAATGANTVMRYGNKLAVRGAAENALNSLEPRVTNSAVAAPPPAPRQLALSAPTINLPNGQVSPPVPLALPSPKSPIPNGPLVAGGGGVLRPQTYGESTQAAQMAAKESEMGYDPGTRAVQAQNQRSNTYDKLEADFQARKNDQMVSDWLNQQEDPFSALDSQLNYMVTRAAESGQPIGPIGEAMLRARQNGNLAQRAGNVPINKFQNMTREQAEAEFQKGKR